MEGITAGFALYHSTKESNLAAYVLFIPLGLMKKFLVFHILFVLVTTSVIYSSGKNTIDDIYKHPQFLKWIEFWKLKIPEIENTTIEKTDSIKWRNYSKIDLKKWVKERELREYTLDFSSSEDFIADKYSYISFENKNDIIFVNGRDVDAFFQVVNTKDSVAYHITLNPRSFFDESIWISDSICCFLGFAYDDFSPMESSKAYNVWFIIVMDFSHNTLSISFSQKLPYYKELMNFKTYMKYLYPEFKYTI